MIKAILTAVSVAILASSDAAAEAPPTPLFASDDPIRLTLRGPISAVATGQRGARPATLTLESPSSETLSVRLSPRGITRLKRDVCQFAPMRVELAAQPPETSLFRGQRRLKLVTHCRAAESFQQHLLLEYAAYRLYNALTPASYRVRLAQIDYIDDSGRPLMSRLGFFIEDIDDVAARNGTRSPRVGREVPMTSLDPVHATRMALFNYMIGNLDWSARAGPAGDECCHNARLIGAPGAGGRLVPVPYDFDFTGLVGAPYAVPPDVLPVRNVRQRYYRGYCAHNSQALTLAADFRSRRPQLLAVLSQIPQLEERTRARAAQYLDGFFADIADDATLTKKLLRTCS